MRIQSAAGVAIVAVIGLGASACSSPGQSTDEPAIPPFDNTIVSADDDLTVAHALEAFPAATPGDWVSYADHVSIFTVLDEHELPWGAYEREHDEGRVGREVTIRIDQTVWRSGTTPPVPDKYRALTDGWALAEGTLSPMGSLGGPRLEVGEQYLAPWIYSSESGWGVLSVTAVFPVDSYGRARVHEWSEPSAAQNAVVGVLPEQVSQTLSQATPDPRVAAFADLEPWARRVAIDLSQLPDRPGYLKATRERLVGSQLGYVREEDWRRLEAEQDTTTEVPFYDEAGNQAAPDEGGGITLNGFVLER